jgi:hypothetical protein
VKNVQAQAKMDAADKKQADALNNANSKAAAPGIAATLKAEGITATDPNFGTILQSWIKDHPESSITDPNILAGEVTTQLAVADKADLAARNTNSTINKRNTPSTKTTTTTDAAAKKGVIANITSRFGQQTPDASGYSVRGTDNYIDPAEYINAYHQWTTKYSDADFIKNFPAKNLINPDSYATLPKQLQPVAKVGAVGFVSATPTPTK